MHDLTIRIQNPFQFKKFLHPNHWAGPWRSQNTANVSAKFQRKIIHPWGAFCNIPELTIFQFPHWCFEDNVFRRFCNSTILELYPIFILIQFYVYGLSTFVYHIPGHTYTREGQHSLRCIITYACLSTEDGSARIHAQCYTNARRLDSSELRYTVNKYSLLMHCIKIKSRAKSLLNEQYVFVGGNISFHCVLSCISEEA